MKKKLLNAAKWLWILVVLVAAGFVVFKRYDQIAEQLKQVAWWQIGLSLFIFFIFKMLFVELSRQSVLAQGWRPPWPLVLKINSVSQLGKYLPGGVWHFVGRAAYYKSGGLTVKQIAKAMLMENLWIGGGACLIAGCFGIPYAATYFPAYAEIINSPAARVGGIALVIAGWICALLVIRKFLSSGEHRPAVAVISMVSGGAWILMGISFWVLLVGGWSWNLLFFLLGVFAIAWLAGFVVPFAPAGVGVREAVIVFLLRNVIPEDQAIVMAGIHRLVTILVEFALGLLSNIQLRKSPQSAPPVEEVEGMVKQEG